jgi:hypothetical protein
MVIQICHGVANVDAAQIYHGAATFDGSRNLPWSARLGVVRHGADCLESAKERLKEICPRGNNNIVIIIFLVHDNAYIPC